MKAPLQVLCGRTIPLWLVVLAAGAPIYAQQRTSPHIGYVFPAGGQRGAVCECVIGGQFLEGARDLYISGSGVRATINQYDKPLSQMRSNELRMYLEDARKKATEAKTASRNPREFDDPAKIASILKEAGATEYEIKRFVERRKQQVDPKRQQNQQIAETVTLKIEIAPDAQTGPRELRMVTPSGLSNPISFCVGTLPEQRDASARDATSGSTERVSLPVVLNGQILPGGVDHFSFEARRGAHLVIAVQARDLVPFLADAVPGWFQPVAVLYDAKGKEVAYGSDYRFSPDPIFSYEVPQAGVYTLEIRDALYRGREDFVFRVTAGEIPYITGIFPLGGRVGVPTTVDAAGWNLPNNHFVLNPFATEGIRPVAGLGNGFMTVDPLFAVDALPSLMKEQLKETPDDARAVTLPVVVNGRINAPGDVDVYAFSCGGGMKIVAEVTARRLNSPLDSWLKVTDATGRQLAFNDDWEDKGAGLLTAQADSYLTFTAPSRGLYFLHIGDSQGKGGPEFGYRLRISAPRPDFALRIVPSCVNALPNTTVLVTVYALRRDGFAGDIALTLKDAPDGMVLNGSLIPAGQDKVRATLTFPAGPADQPLKLSVEGDATIEGAPVRRQAVPAEDMTQAFMIHHLVPENQLLAVVTGSNRGRVPMEWLSPGPIKLRAGGSGQAILSSNFRRYGFPLADTRLKLSEPPDGITVQELSEDPKGFLVSIRADSKVKPGLRGNLIFEAFREQTLPNTPAGRAPEKRLNSLGLLPAIPFEVTGP